MPQDHIVDRRDLEIFGLSSQGYMLEAEVYDESAVALKLDFYGATGEKHKHFHIAKAKASTVMKRIENDLKTKYDIDIDLDGSSPDAADIVMNIGKKGGGNDLGQRHQGDQFTFPKALLDDIQTAATAAFHAEGISEDFGYTRVEIAGAMAPHRGKMLTDDVQRQILKALEQPQHSRAR